VGPPQCPDASEVRRIFSLIFSLSAGVEREERGTKLHMEGLDARPAYVGLSRVRKYDNAAAEQGEIDDIGARLDPAVSAGIHNLMSTQTNSRDKSEADRWAVMYLKCMPRHRGV
jgi:hypothetical protein